MNDQTFSNQSAAWLKDLAQRKRNPLAPASLRAFGVYVRKLTPMIGDTPLADINNGVAKQIVTTLCDQGLSPKTVNEILATFKAVVASAVDPATGRSIFPVEWNSKFIDAPQIKDQDQPCATKKDVERCIKDAASSQERLFYALLAGTGLRVAEALSLRVQGNQQQTSWNESAASIDVRSSIHRGKEQPRVKTRASIRTVDLDPQLNALIAGFVCESKTQPGAFLFQSRSGRAMHLITASVRLKKHDVKGFHAFRRFRITHLREHGVPEDILRFWVGHAGAGITDRYSKLAERVELRKQWCERAGLGFEISLTGPKSPSYLLEPIVMESGYVAVDEDLPEIFATPVTEAI